MIANPFRRILAAGRREEPEAATGGRTLVIHIGPHKTGTTAIQQSLLENGPLLGEAGYAYPEVGFLLFGHHGLAGFAREGRTAELDEAVAAINRAPGNVVLSSENFSLLSPEAAARLRRGLRFDRTRVVYYLRNFVTTPYSLWQESVKHRDERTFERFAADLFLDPFREIVYDVGRTLGAFEAAFGRAAIELHVYDDAVDGKGDILGHFWKDVLGSPEKAKLKKRANQSFHPAATELLRICNLHGYTNQFLFRDNPDWKAFLEALREIAPRHQRTLTVDYGTVFGEVERRVLDRWRDRIVGGLPGGVLFRERSATIAYMDPDLWHREPALFDRLRTLIGGLPASR